MNFFNMNRNNKWKKKITTWWGTDPSTPQIHALMKYFFLTYVWHFSGSLANYNVHPVIVLTEQQENKIVMISTGAAGERFKHEKSLKK